MIEASNLILKYGDFTAVDQISFSIKKGEIVGLLGHNGAGKSTTMKMLTGYLEPTQGDVCIDGMTFQEDRLKIQKKIGYLPENTPTYPEMTVVQYLEYVTQLRSISGERKYSAIQDAIAETALADKACSKISTLSKGFRQRVGVAQAIIHKPEILILDEPTSGLDPTQIIEMRGLIKRLSKNATVILSTHILQEVEAICDRVIIILQGKIATDDHLANLQASDTLSVSLNSDLNSTKRLLQQIDGVEDISLTSNGGDISQFRITLSSEHKGLPPIIAKAVINEGWELYSMQKDHRNLEAIFREINSGKKGVANV